MICPTCKSSELVEGEFRLKKSTMDWLFFGFGWSNLTFRAGKKLKPKVVMGDGGLRPGYRCSECTTLILLPDRDSIRRKQN